MLDCVRDGQWVGWVSIGCRWSVVMWSSGLTFPEGRARMDEDLDGMSREQLLNEVRRLRAGIREHRDSTGQELCWHHPRLWGLLPEKTDPIPVVPEWPQFMRGCVRYRQSLDEQAPNAPRSDEPYRK
jgi:hypothetical protein